jgi:hypothetical protein
LGEVFASVGVHLGSRYVGSPVNGGDGAPPADEYLRYMPSGVPGGRAPHLWTNEGRGYGDSLYDRLGRGFTLLRLGGQTPDASPLLEAAARRGLPLATLDVAGDAARDLYQRDLVLVRPDQYVAWRGNAMPAEPDRLLAQLAGAL